MLKIMITGALATGTWALASPAMAATPTPMPIAGVTASPAPSAVVPTVPVVQPTIIQHRAAAIALPTVTGVSPNYGSSAGGQIVQVNGTGFMNGATTVAFGGVQSPSVQVYSSTTLNAMSPAVSVAGNQVVNITVTTAAGTSIDPPADQFTYMAGNQTATSYPATSYVTQPSYIVQQQPVTTYLQQQPSLIYQQQEPSYSYPVTEQAVPAATAHRASRHMSCRVWVSPSRPRRYQAVTVSVATEKGSWVQSRARFAHGDWYQWQPHSKGIDHFYYNIGSPRYGFRVHELVTVSNGSRKGKCQSSWLPRH